jgi:hypothetical protein
MKVGIVLAQAAEDGAGGTWTEIAGLARQAEDGGLDIDAVARYRAA